MVEASDEDGDDDRDASSGGDVAYVAYVAVSGLIVVVVTASRSKDACETEKRSTEMIGVATAK